MGITDKIIIDDEEGQGAFRLVKDKTAPCRSVWEVGILRKKLIIFFGSCLRWLPSRCKKK
jgi:hypothetical protein